MLNFIININQSKVDEIINLIEDDIDDPTEFVKIISSLFEEEEIHQIEDAINDNFYEFVSDLYDTRNDDVNVFLSFLQDEFRNIGVTFMIINDTEEFDDNEFDEDEFKYFDGEGDDFLDDETEFDDY